MLKFVLANVISVSSMVQIAYAVHCGGASTWCAAVTAVPMYRMCLPMYQASKFVKIHGSKLLLLSLRAGRKTIFVVANLWGFKRPRPIHGSYSGSACPQVCYNVIDIINIMIYGSWQVWLHFVWLNNVRFMALAL